MQRKPVNSSNISSIGYDASSHTLEIQFHDGGVYCYGGVPQSEFAALMAASSHGSYHARHIKDRYPATKVA